jgi:hypothetical protein
MIYANSRRTDVSNVCTLNWNTPSHSFVSLRVSVVLYNAKLRVIVPSPAWVKVSLSLFFRQIIIEVCINGLVVRAACFLYL